MTLSCAYLVRHADAVWGTDDTGGLSEKGRRDAERLAVALADIDCAAIYSSPYRRARETIEPFASRRGLPIHERSDLRERSLGPGAFPDFRAAVRATWEDFSFAHPGGESNAAAQRRIVSAYDALVARHSDGRILICTHGNVLALLLAHFDPAVGFAFWEAMTRPDVYRVWVGVGGRAPFERIPTG